MEKNYKIKEKDKLKKRKTNRAYRGHLPWFKFSWGASCSPFAGRRLCRRVDSHGWCRVSLWWRYFFKSFFLCHCEMAERLVCGLRSLNSELVTISCKTLGFCYNLEILTRTIYTNHTPHPSHPPDHKAMPTRNHCTTWSSIYKSRHRFLWGVGAGWWHVEKMLGTACSIAARIAEKEGRRWPQLNPIY